MAISKNMSIKNYEMKKMITDRKPSYLLCEDYIHRFVH